MAAKAIAFQEASMPAFKKYAHHIVENARAMAEAFMAQKVKVLTGGTDNHLLVLDVASSFNINGRQAELLLREAHLTVNRNAIPRDVNGPWYTSGVRVGTPAMTTLGMREKEMREIASIIIDLLKEATPTEKAKAHVPAPVLARAQNRVRELMKHFPLYPELVIE
jgi:glycine hydroxymethyltransferase